MRRLQFVILLGLLAFNKFTSSAPSGGQDLIEQIQQLNIILLIAGFYGLRIVFHWDYQNGEMRYVDAHGVDRGKHTIPLTTGQPEGTWLIRRSDTIGYFTFSMIFVEWPVNLAVQHNGPGRRPIMGSVVHPVILNGLIRFRARQVLPGHYQLMNRNVASNVQYDDFTVFDSVVNENGGRETLRLTEVQIYVPVVRGPCGRRREERQLSQLGQLPVCPTPGIGGIDVPHTVNPVQPKDCLTTQRQIGECSTRDPCEAFQGIPDQTLHQLQDMSTWTLPGSSRPRVTIGTITRPAHLPARDCTPASQPGPGDPDYIGHQIEEIYRIQEEERAAGVRRQVQAEGIWRTGYINFFEEEAEEPSERETRDFLSNFGGVEQVRHDLDLSLQTPGAPPPPPPGSEVVRDPRKGKGPAQLEFRPSRKLLKQNSLADAFLL